MDDIIGGLLLLGVLFGLEIVAIFILIMSAVYGRQLVFVIVLRRRRGGADGD